MSLALLIVALLCVGLVSRTIVRHIVQAIPPVIALILVAGHSRLAPSAAAPILTFWLGVMINIWLFILGIARIFSGTFSGVEIALTIVIAIASGLGILSIVRWGTRLAPAPRLATATAFGIAQLGGDGCQLPVRLIRFQQPVHRQRRGVEETVTASTCSDAIQSSR